MGYFRDDKGKKSMMRLKVFWAFFTAILLALVTCAGIVYFEFISTVENPKAMPTSALVTIIGTLLAYAGATKVFQKRIEKTL